MDPFACMFAKSQGFLNIFTESNGIRNKLPNKGANDTTVSHSLWMNIELGVLPCHWVSEPSGFEPSPGTRHSSCDTDAAMQRKLLLKFTERCYSVN